MGLYKLNGDKHECHFVGCAMNATCFKNKTKTNYMDV